MPRMAETARTLCALEGMLGVSSAQPDMWRPGEPGHDALLSMDEYKEVMDGE